MYATSRIQFETRQKKDVVASAIGSPEHDGPVASARGVENDTQHVWDQVVLDCKEEATKRTLTKDEDATRVLTRTRESRAETEKRNRERKEAFKKKKAKK